VVSLEWQSLQERSRIAFTAGGTGIVASMVFFGSMRGFVRAGR
jgi:hypothetical protein